MLNFLNRETKQLITCFLVCVISILSFHAQENKSIPRLEKVYIHTDRTTYTLGESLWYKVYSVYAYNHLLYNESNILYVELISPDSKLIARNKTRLFEGLGNGDFELVDSLGVKKAGTYQLRAYTNFSRNFGTDFVFKKDIEIIDVFNKSEAKGSKLDNLKPIANNSKEALENTFNVQFFPEGGSLVNDVESAVAFKVEDAKGKPIEVKGKVFESNGALVALFITKHNGMGKFPFKPLKGKSYYAEVSVLNGVPIKVSFPNAQETGYLLSFKKIRDKDVITIKTNQETLSQKPNEELTLICTTRGITYFEGTQPLTQTAVSFQLNNSDFPEGITQVTLYDASAKPHSERLFFIEKEHDVQVDLTTDKKIYKPAEKVTVTVTSKTKNGDVAPASFSLSCTDTNGINNEKDYSTTISSYFLMESDIRGKVYNPSYYFDISNTKRLEHLDLLLLTQGWRDFIWKTIPQPQDSIRYNVEKSFTIAGSVKQLLGNKPKANSNITLALMNKDGLNISNTVTNSSGGFKFDNLIFYGKTTMFLNSKNEKGKSNGEIIYYPVEKPPMKVDINKKALTFTDTTTNTIKENIYKKYVLYGIAPENVLDEVEIIAKKKNNTPSLYGMPDFSYVVGDETPVFNDIYQLIQYKIPGVMVDGDTIRFMRFNGAAHIIVDGFPLNDPSQLTFVLPDNVERIDAIKGPSAAIFGSEGANGVIAIYTKNPLANVQSKKVFHSIKETVEGFYNARVFYTPNLETTSFETDSKLAVRNTLYWNPYIFPNEKTGIFQTTYSNSDVQTKVKVSLEGITASGIPIVLKTDYVIEK